MEITKPSIQELKKIVERSEYYQYMGDNSVENCYVKHIARSNVVKQVLSAVYGYRNVSVRKGAGTATYWLDIGIVLSGKGLGNPAQKENEVRNDVEKLLKDVGITFPKYLTDYGGSGDGYEDCVNVFMSLKS